MPLIRHIVAGVSATRNLSEDDQLRAAGYFGKVAVRRKPAAGSTHPGGDCSTRRSCWSPTLSRTANRSACSATARCGFTTTPAITRSRTARRLLYSMKLPSWGGNTCFSNMYKAYENIPPALRDRLEGRKVLQVHDYKRRERLDIDTIDLTNVRHQGSRSSSRIRRPGGSRSTSAA